MNKTKYIRVRLTEQEKNDITKLAKINQITVSELVRHMIYCETVLFAKGVSKCQENKTTD